MNQRNLPDKSPTNEQIKRCKCYGKDLDSLTGICILYQ